jgi:hypothetical protein
MISIPGTAAIACIFGYFFSQESGDNGTWLTSFCEQNIRLLSFNSQSCAVSKITMESKLAIFNHHIDSNADKHLQLFFQVFMGNKNQKRRLMSLLEKKPSKWIADLTV